MCCGCSTDTPHEGYAHVGHTSLSYVFEGFLCYADTPKQDAYYREFYWAINFIVCDTVTKPYYTEVRLTVAIQLTTQKLQLLAPPKKCSLSRDNAGHCCCCYQCTLYFCMEIVLYFTPRTHKIDKKGRGTVFTLSSVHFPISSGLFVGCLKICFCQSPRLMGEIFMFREKSERI